MTTNDTASVHEIPVKESEPWEGIVLPQGYTISLDDVKSKDIRISGPVWVEAATEDIASEEFGIVICWIDLKGKLKRKVFSRDVLYEQGKNTIQQLARKGLDIHPGKYRQLQEYLSEFKPETYIQSVNRGGWIDSLSGDLIYVFPSEQGIVKTDSGEQIAFQPEQHSPTTTTIYSQGTLKEWKESVASPCQGNPFLIAAVCFSFASPLLKPARLESGGIHLYGVSTRGKTTAAQVAASVYGCAADPSDAPDKSYLQRWNSTGNALEGLLAAHNDMLLVLDEIQTCDAKDFGKVVYNMSGGKGKAALDKERNLRQQRGWRVLYLSTGNQSSQWMIQQENRKANSAQLLRLLDIPAHENIIVDPHGDQPAEFATRLKYSCGQYFGTAGKEFIVQIKRRFENISALSSVVRNELEKVTRHLTPENCEPEQRRAISRLALIQVAGEMASEYGVVPFTKEEIGDAVEVLTSAWLSDSVNLPDRIRGLQALQNFILENRNRFHKPDEDDTLIHPIAGYIQFVEGKKHYLFTDDGLNKAIAGFDRRDVIKELKSIGCLFTREKDRDNVRLAVPGVDGRPRFYAIQESLLTYDFTLKCFSDE